MFAAGWTRIVDTGNGVFFYRSSDGLAAFGTFDSSGKFSQLRSYPVGGVFAAGWTHIVDTGNGVFFYRSL